MTNKFPGKCSKCGGRVPAQAGTWSRATGLIHTVCPDGKQEAPAKDYKPTAEQQVIIEAALAGESFVTQARAGSGKTTTARAVAKALLAAKPQLKILYLAFNKSTQVEAEQSFPRNTTCKTSHSLAWSIGKTYTHRMTKPFGNAPRVPAWQIAKALHVNDVTVGDGTDVETVDATRVVRIAQGIVARYARSADQEIGRHHFRWVQGLENHHDELAEVVLPLARELWADVVSGHIQNVQGEHYIKLYQLSRPRLPYDVIIYDEAQDANGAVADIVSSQEAQLIPIGDSAQAINGWNGAVDALAKFEAQGLWAYPLSQSFRFGQAVADEGNVFLQLLGVPEGTLVKGFDKIESRVVTREDITPDAVLCRTNGGVIGTAMSYLGEGKKVSVVGGVQNFRELAESALSLQAGGKAKHTDLLGFADWAEVQAYAKEDEGADLRPFVKLIDTHGASAVIDSMARVTSDEGKADVVISTAHKAKGREWKRVLVHDDFESAKPKDNADGSKGEVSAATAMLAYVTLTRAQEELCIGGLSWGRDYL